MKQVAAAPEAQAWEICFYIWGVWICISDRLSAAQWSACFSLMAPAVQHSKQMQGLIWLKTAQRGTVWTRRSPNQVGTPPIHASWVALSLIRLLNLDTLYALLLPLSLYSILSTYSLLCKFLILYPLLSLKICNSWLLVPLLCILKI